MNAGYGPVRREERPAPVVIHDGMVVPGALCAELSAALDLLEAFINGTPPPAACRAPRMSRVALAVRVAAQAAGVDHQRQRTRLAIAAANVPPVTVLAPATAEPMSTQQEMVTTEQAATITGLTEQRIRQLASAGTIRGIKAGRNVWLLDPESVRAYRRRRSHGAGTDVEREAHGSAA